MSSTRLRYPDSHQVLVSGCPRHMLLALPSVKAPMIAARPLFSLSGLTSDFDCQLPAASLWWRVRAPSGQSGARLSRPQKLYMLLSCLCLIFRHTYTLSRAHSPYLSVHTKTTRISVLISIKNSLMHGLPCRSAAKAPGSQEEVSTAKSCCRTDMEVPEDLDDDLGWMFLLRGRILYDDSVGLQDLLGQVSSPPESTGKCGAQPL